jgi:hypothetical protein
MSGNYDIGTSQKNLEAALSMKSLKGSNLNLHQLIESSSKFGGVISNKELIQSKKGPFSWIKGHEYI